MRKTGVYVNVRTAVEPFRAFVPHPLPPQPPLALTPADLTLLSEADRELGRLDGMAVTLPDIAFFIYFYVRKEAVLSSQIEGTQSSLSELLLFESEELPGAPVDDLREVSNYVDALTYGLDRLAELPLSLRLIRELHARLLAHGRGANKSPGEFRRSQNWIGGSRPGTARFVPPPPDRLMECLDAFEKFLHAADPAYPPLVKAALLHVQFETIHPFLDGNGRVGRLLIALYLCASGALRQPLLYLSLFFKRHRSLYYEHLTQVRMAGAWEDWVRFFLEGVAETARSGVETALRLRRLAQRDEARVHDLPRIAGNLLRMLRAFQGQPVATAAQLGQRSGQAKPTVLRGLAKLTELGIVREITGRAKRRVFAYEDYLAILSEGTEPL